jgi:hypothetical protein
MCKLEIDGVTEWLLERTAVTANGGRRNGGAVGSAMARVEVSTTSMDSARGAPSEEGSELGIQVLAYM